MGATLDLTPGNQRRSVCLPASVLVRAQLVDSACGLLGPGCRSKHWTGVGGSRMAHGRAACCAWVQLRHCMFNWTLALARTEMHGVGSCRSSKDDFKQHRILRPFFLLFFTRQQTTFQVCARKKINTRTIIRAFAALSYSLQVRPSANHAASRLARTTAGQLRGAARGHTPISIIPRLESIMDRPSPRPPTGPGSPEPSAQPKRAQTGSGVGMPCQMSRRFEMLHKQ